MTISKELFGIERKEKVTSHALCGSMCCCDEEVSSFNECVDLIDQYEISEEGILEALSTIPSTHVPISMINDKVYYYMNKEFIAQIIIQNQSKIFVKRGNNVNQ